ncbi:MAG TPA: amidohydrolase family protein, partial [Ilumatobacteraceae bacterium]|nr:amidohydrolase family protein [Ilumatobacteraceae bacterium]
EVADLPLAQRVAALNEPQRHHRLIHEIPDDGGFFVQAVLTKTDRMWAAADGAIDYEPDTAHSIAAQAQRQGVPAMQLIVDQLCSADGHGMIYAPFFNYSYGDLSFSYTANLHPHTRLGLSDAGAHCGTICDGGVPTFMLTHWARDRRRGPRLPLEFVVHRQTAQTASLYGLDDRGTIAAGKRADLNLIDFDALTFGPARMAFDLPAGGKRLVQRASGYVGTWVAGTRTVANDEFTGELPGRVLRARR